MSFCWFPSTTLANPNLKFLVWRLMHQLCQHSDCAIMNLSTPPPPSCPQLADTTAVQAGQSLVDRPGEPSSCPSVDLFLNTLNTFVQLKAKSPRCWIGILFSAVTPRDLEASLHRCFANPGW